MKLTKRQALIALLAIPMASWRGLKVHAAGVLTYHLDQWTAISVEYKGRRVLLTPGEIFEVLSERG